MNREGLSKYLGITGTTLGQVEKDYFQHLLLAALSRKMGGFLVFKGGTSLQKVGVVRRFSEDLDFTWSGRSIRIQELLETTVSAVHNYGYRCTYDRVKQTDRSAGYRLLIEGPLQRDRKGVCSVRVEVSLRETVVLPPDRREFVPPYADILPYVMEVLQLREILSEKVRALSTRQKARDLYDLTTLLRLGVPLDPGLADRKLTYYGKKFEPAAFLVRCKGLETRWRTELPIQIDPVPPFPEALALVRKALDALPSS